MTMRQILPYRYGSYGSRIFRRGTFCRGTVRRKRNHTEPNLTETNIFFTAKCPRRKIRPWKLWSSKELLRKSSPRTTLKLILPLRRISRYIHIHICLLTFYIHSLIFVFLLLPSPVHLTWFSFNIFPNFLAIFILLSSNSNNNYTFFM